MLKFPNDYCRLEPTEKQQAFLDLETLEVFFGGAAGGGKSIALLMAALQYVDQPGYAALILRKDTQRLSLPGGLIPRSHEWLTNTDARWNAARRTWTFPHEKGPPATLTFGYLAKPDDKYRYLSSEFQYIAFDELTELTEDDYLYLFSRLRKAKTLNVPLRIRSASNPGGPGHVWVKQRFVGNDSSKFQVHSSTLAASTLNLEPAALNLKTSRVFFPSRLADNPYLNADEYRRSLSHLDPLARERLLNGDWNVQEQGLIRAAWLRYYTQSSTFEVQSSRSESTWNREPETLNLEQVDGRSLAQIDPAKCRRFITVDPAGTSADRAREARGRQPSYTVAQVWEQPRGELSRFLILRHQVRDLLGFDQIIALLQELHETWRPERIWIEHEKLGQAAFDELHRKLPMDLVPTRGDDKAARASTLVLKFSRGEIFLSKHENSWLPALEAELLAWTGKNDEPADQIDAAAYAAIISQTAAPGILVMQHIVSHA